MQGAAEGGRLVCGRYRLQERIGGGAMAIVWRARDEVLDREVAVKEARESGLATAESGSVYQETLREARAAARLNHPGVVAIFDVVEEGGSPWIVMELVPGRSLDRLIAEDGPLPPLRAARVGADLLSALACAHSAGVLHRDVKPGNVLVGPDDRTVLTDFGIARSLSDPSLTPAGKVLGTPGFTAPERIRGGPASPASDLWSLGATLFTAVEGRGPFERPGGADAITAAVIGGDVPRAPSAGPLGPVIVALLRSDPDHRPDAASAARLLARAAAEAESGSWYPGELPVSGDARVLGDGLEINDLHASVGPPVPASLAVAAGLPVPADPPAFSDLPDPPWLPSPAGPGAAGRVAAGPAGPAGPATTGLIRGRRRRVSRRARVSMLTAAAVAAVVVGAGLGVWAVYPRMMTAAPPTHAALASPREAHRSPAPRVTEAAPPTHAAPTSPPAVQPGPAPSATAAPVVAGPAMAAAQTRTTACAGRVAATTAGYRWIKVTAASSGTRAGFELAAPTTWLVTRQVLATYLRPPAGRAYIAVSLAPFKYPSPLREARFLQAQALEQARYPQYRLTAIVVQAFRCAPAAVWRFSWDQRGVGQVDVFKLLLNENTPAGGQTYALTVSAPSAGFPAADAIFRRALRTFRPLA